jgi:glycine hydroxymethyltransferase
MLKDFKAKVDEDPDVRAKIKALKNRVEDFAVTFPMPGFDEW